jgi:transcriptional regulator with XRE-family HTH domain
LSGRSAYFTSPQKEKIMNLLDVTGSQLKAARLALQLDQVRLARECGISASTIKALERTHGSCNVSTRILRAVLKALGDRGVAFSGTGFSINSTQANVA